MSDDGFDRRWFWAVNENGEVWVCKDISGEFEAMKKTRQAYLSKSAAQIAAPLIVELTAERAKVKELEAAFNSEQNRANYLAEELEKASPDIKHSGHLLRQFAEAIISQRKGV